MECLTITANRSRAHKKEALSLYKHASPFVMISISKAEMSRRAKHQPPPAAGSRRTRRAELPPPPPGLAETRAPQIVSNPIFRWEAGPGPSQPSNKRPSPGDQLRCAYRPGSLYALVHDPDPASGSGIGRAHPQPLPLPPCRAHPSGRVGPAHAVAVPPHARLLRRAARAPHDDPFLAAYVACRKSAGGGGKDAAAAEAAVDRRRPQHKQKQGPRRRRKRKCKEGEALFRGCGIWRRWAAGATKYAGAMSCRYGACAVAACAVAAGHKGDAPAAATKSERKDASAAGPTLDLSWTPAVLSARALERREQR